MNGWIQSELNSNELMTKRKEGLVAYRQQDQTKNPLNLVVTRILKDINFVF